MIGITEQDKAAIVAWAQDQSIIRRVYLFGSRSRGDHRPDSDLDLAIELFGRNLEARYGSWGAIDEELLQEIQQLLPYVVQLEWYDPEEKLLGTVGPAVRNDGILLFERA